VREDISQDISRSGDTVVVAEVGIRPNETYTLLALVQGKRNGDSILLTLHPHAGLDSSLSFPDGQPTVEADGHGRLEMPRTARYLAERCHSLARYALHSA
jgi:hypothetical protein